MFFHYSHCRKKAVKSDISLEERIKQLTCDIDEDLVEELSRGVADADQDQDLASDRDCSELAQRDSPAGEENPNTLAPKFMNGEKSFSPSSSVSSSSSGSSAYKKIADIFSRDKKQEKIMELEENPIVIIPQVSALWQLEGEGARGTNLLYS